jgi:hypothetical protein
LQFLIIDNIRKKEMVKKSLECRTMDGKNYFPQNFLVSLGIFEKNIEARKQRPDNF